MYVYIYIYTYIYIVEYLHISMYMGDILGKKREITNRSLGAAMSFKRTPCAHLLPGFA